jgi:3-oxoacyl-[acyl-carrier-protein] synthase-1
MSPKPNPQNSSGNSNENSQNHSGQSSKANSRTVRITATGAATCAGIGVENFWSSVCEGKSGIQSGSGRIDSLNDKKRRSLQLVRLALSEALKKSGWKDWSDTVFFLSTTTGYVQEWEEKVITYKKDKSTEADFFENFKREALHILWEDVKNEFQIEKDAIVLSTACAAGAQGVGLAKLYLESGKYKKAVVVGVETLSLLTDWGFGSFQLTTTQTCRPFDRGREGINLSEAGSAVLLELSDDSRLTVVAGGGFGSDSFSMTSPHPEGRGLHLAIQSALQSAGVETSEIDGVHSHGTGSRHNDQAEAHVFSQMGFLNAPIASTKGIHGHALAAAGVLETIVCDQILKTGFFPGTFGCEESEYKNLKISSQPIENLNPKTLLKTTLGFGGANAALVFKRGDVV